MIAAHLGGFSFSFTLHGPAIFFAPQLWRLDEKIKRARFVACISHYCRSQAMIYAPPQTWDRLHIVHCGIDPQLFTPRSHQGRAEKLLFVGRLTAVKGLGVLFKALTAVKLSHPQVHLTVVGDGPDRALLETQVRELGLQQNVSFVGYRTQDQVRQHLAETDIFVMSSFAEGVPVVLMEAMAAGVAVIAPRIAGIPELIDDGQNGYLTPPGDVQTLTERITTLMQDAELRSRFAASGTQKVQEHFNLHHEAAWLGRIMRHALGPAAADAPEALGPRPVVVPQQQKETA